MRMAGLSIAQISAPVIFIALIGVGASIFINFYYSPKARTIQKYKVSNLLRYDPEKLIKPRKFIKEFPGLILYVTERDGNQFKDLWVWELDDQHRVTRFIRAKTGELKYDREEDALKLTCYEGVGEKRSKTDPENFFGTALLTTDFHVWSIRISMELILGKMSVHRKLSMLTLGELLDFRAEGIAKEKQGDPGGRLQHIQAQMQVQENFATSFAALSLALIGIPLGIKISRSETMANLAIALALGLLYYLLMKLIGMLKGQPEWRPDLLIWIPNIMFQALGIYMLRKLSIR